MIHENFTEFSGMNEIYFTAIIQCDEQLLPQTRDRVHVCAQSEKSYNAADFNDCFVTKTVFIGMKVIIYVQFELVPNNYYSLVFRKLSIIRPYRRFNAIASQLKMHYFSGGAFESLISSQLLKKEKYI